MMRCSSHPPHAHAHTRKKRAAPPAIQLLTHDLPTNRPSHDPAPPPGVAHLAYRLCRRRTSCPLSRRCCTPCPPSHAPFLPADLDARRARSPKAATRCARRTVAKRSRPALRPRHTPAKHTFAPSRAESIWHTARLSRSVDSDRGGAAELASSELASASL